MKYQTNQSEFTKGSMAQNILRLAIPMTFAQLINLLYSIIDRVYIGHIGQDATLALGGVGLTFPIITIISAFANLFGTGGSPLFSISRGQKENEKALNIMGNCFSMLVLTGLFLTIFCMLLKRPILFLFGASEVTFPYADSYITVYLIGTVFVMITLGMNNFINAQGFGRKGMMTILIGAVLNIILDPIFIFLLHMRVAGAALATILSQAVSALWVTRFLFGRNSLMPITQQSLRIRPYLLKEICSLGLSGFVMSVTNGMVQIACNAMLQSFGGDLYVGVMAVLNSIREVITMPVMGLTNAAQPVLGFNFGAEENGRVKDGIRFVSILCIVYTLSIWLVLLLFPEAFIHIFNSDPRLLEAGKSAMYLYFFGIFMMALQFSGQCVFTALGRAKYAVFFSLFRKAIIVVPLTLLLPHIGGLGVNGVFLAEPVSNFIGGTACFVTMYFTVWKALS